MFIGAVTSNTRRTQYYVSQTAAKSVIVGVDPEAQIFQINLNDCMSHVLLSHNRWSLIQNQIITFLNSVNQGLKVAAKVDWLETRINCCLLIFLWRTKAISISRWLLQEIGYEVWLHAQGTCHSAKSVRIIHTVISDNYGGFQCTASTLTSIQWSHSEKAP